MQRPTMIATATASAALLALAGAARADVVDTRELMETVPVAANEPLVVIVRNIVLLEIFIVYETPNAFARPSRLKGAVGTRFPLRSRSFSAS